MLPSGIGDFSASSTAASISALTLSRIACVSTPSASRRLVWRSIGSLRRHSSTFSEGTYFMSSCAAWPCMRIVTASTSVGPSPASARSRAIRTTSNIASGSLPSALTPGKPYAAARSIGLTANCWSTGVEYAYWLFSSTKITGSFCTPAQFIASWKSPRLTSSRRRTR